ncbi:glycosyltransferase [Methylobacterium fujisawaense]|uniref:glycosyltransferase n=1 Tax=Methylobacterium fujisawaense TaxID=107400 RepID=UPI00313A95C8
MRLLSGISKRQSLRDLFFTHEGKAVDKWENYLDVYERELARFRDQDSPVDLLEIGVQNGGSLELWAAWLPKQSVITGIDIDEKVGDLKFASPRVTAHVADATKVEELSRVLGRRTFDIIIDDGSHVSSDIISTLRALYERVRPGGLYIIEDLHCSYFPSHKGGLRAEGAAIEQLKGIVDEINSDHWIKAENENISGETRRAFVGSTASITFYDSMAIIEKSQAERTIPFRRVYSGLKERVEPASNWLVDYPRSSLNQMLFGRKTALRVDADLKRLADEAIARASRLEAELKEARKRLPLFETETTVLDETGISSPTEIIWGSDIEDVRCSGLFFTEWYVARNLDVAAAGLRGLEHYLNFGGLEGRSPNPLFDGAWYLKQYGDVADAKFNPLLHFIRHGWLEGRKPHPLFDTSWYVKRYGHLIAEGDNPLNDYITIGWKEGRWPNPLFDGKYYLDVYRHQLDPDTPSLVHYIEHGSANGFDPCPAFDSAWYLEKNLDVASERRNPLIHYIENGAAEGRDPHPLFYSSWYVGINADCAQYSTPLAHYLHSGDRNLFPNPLFDNDYYISRYGDIAAHDKNPLCHFIEFGAKEGRSPSALFDTAWYLAAYPDIAQSGLNALTHFLMDGAFEGRAPHPKFDNSWLLERPSGDARTARGVLERWLRFGRAKGEAYPLILRESRASDALTLLDLCNLNSDELRTSTDVDLTISVLTPIYNTKPVWLKELYQSLRNQTYSGWRWIISDDGSTRSDTLATLHEIAANDERVILCSDPIGGGISMATNRAVEAAVGDYACLVDHDDVLARNALASVRDEIMSNGPFDIIYTDECKLAEDYSIYGIFLKPDWSPVLLQNTMYIGHLTVYRLPFLRDLGGFRTSFDGTQDYDMALRAAAQAPRVAHVPCIAYLWRAVEGSTALRLDEKDGVIAAQEAAVREAAQARATGAVVKPGLSPGFWRVEYPLLPEKALLSYVIPTAGGSRNVRGISVDLLLNCIESLERSGFYGQREYVVVHNGDLTEKQLAALKTVDGVKLVAYTAKLFNLAEKINLGVESASGKFVCLLNDDVEAITPAGGDMLIGFMEHHPQVGAIAPLCLFEDGRVQHDGVMLLEQGPSHAGIMQRQSDFGEHGYLNYRREVFGVTGAMMFVRRALYVDLGGFDVRLPLNYNDVDFCLRLREAGYSCVVDPAVQVYHYESASKTGTFKCEKEELFRRWPALRDPYFNEKFDQRNPAFVPKWPRQPSQFSDPVGFERWLDRRISIRTRGALSKQDELITIAMSVYNGPASQLEEALTSALMQTYRNVEILVVDDGSTSPETRRWLEKVERRDDVRVIRLARNVGIAGAQKALLDAARGDWFVPMDSDDFITVDAVQILSAAAAANPGKSIFYSDEFKSDVQSNKFSPFFKTDFDVVKITNCCYVTHLMMIRTDFLRTINSYSDSQATWCHDWDTTFRAIGAGTEPVHVPELLYAWRINPGSTASVSTGTKPEAINSQRFVLERAIADRALSGQLKVEPNTLGPQTGMWSLVATSPVASVHIASSLDLWRSPVDARLTVLRNMARAGEWVALLTGQEPGGSELNLLALSAVAHWEKRVGVVSGLLSRSNGKVAWSGGVFTETGVIDLHQGASIADGGYHGALYCQRCVDVAPMLDVLIRSEKLDSALDLMEKNGTPVTANSLSLVLGFLADRDGWLIAVTPYVSFVIERSLHDLIPLDRERLAMDETYRVKRSRWYGEHLKPLPLYEPTDFSGDAA